MIDGNNEQQNAINLLVTACKDGDLSLVGDILSKYPGQIVNAIGYPSRRFPLLSTAVQNKHDKLVKMLLNNYNADINGIDNRIHLPWASQQLNASPLHRCVDSGNPKQPPDFDMLCLLIELGANIEIMDSAGGAVIDSFQYCGPAAEFLIEQDCHVSIYSIVHNNFPTSRLLHFNCMLGDYGADLLQRTLFFQSLLVSAIYCGDANVCYELIDRATSRPLCQDLDLVEILQNVVDSLPDQEVEEEDIKKIQLLLQCD